jgi:Transcription factor WhiB
VTSAQLLDDLGPAVAAPRPQQRHRVFRRYDETVGLLIREGARREWELLGLALAASGPVPCELSSRPEAWWTPGLPSLEAMAISECARCPAIRQCLAYALAAAEPHGVWGGRTSRDRVRTARVSSSNA